MPLANKDLSKQLQELSGWVDIGRKNGVEQYSLDFLLEKLQATPNLAGLMLTDEGYYQWRIVGSVNRVMYSYTASTPANAACSLLIKLYEAGILK